MTYREQLNKVNELGISICDLEVANELDAVFVNRKKQGGKNANKKSGQRSRKIPRKGEAAGANLWTLRQRHSKGFRDFAVYALYISLQTVGTINQTAWKDCGNSKA